MCNNVENKQNVVVAPMDTQPLTPNGTKGLWDKHVEMYETTDIPTEYADYSAYEEEWEEAEEIIYDFIMEAILEGVEENYRGFSHLTSLTIIDLPYLLVIRPAIEDEAEKLTEEIMEYIEDFRNCTITEKQAKELLEEVIYYREDINSSAGKIKFALGIIKDIVDYSEDKGLYVGSYMLTVIPDEYGVAYHSKPNTWQRSFGYNVFLMKCLI